MPVERTGTAPAENDFENDVCESGANEPAPASPPSDDAAPAAERADTVEEHPGESFWDAKVGGSAGKAWEDAGYVGEQQTKGVFKDDIDPATIEASHRGGGDLKSWSAGDEKLGGDLALGHGAYSFGASAGVSPEGGYKAEAAAGASISAVHADFHAQSEGTKGGLGVEGQVRGSVDLLGADASLKSGVETNGDGVKVTAFDVRADAFLAKGSISAQASFKLGEDELGSVGATGTAIAGAGVRGTLEGEYKDGHAHWTSGVDAAAGLGGGVQVNGEANLRGIASATDKGTIIAAPTEAAAVAVNLAGGLLASEGSIWDASADKVDAWGFHALAKNWHEVADAAREQGADIQKAGAAIDGVAQDEAAVGAKLVNAAKKRVE